MEVHFKYISDTHNTEYNKVFFLFPFKTPIFTINGISFQMVEMSCSARPIQAHAEAFWEEQCDVF